MGPSLSRVRGRGRANGQPWRAGRAAAAPNGPSLACALPCAQLGEVEDQAALTMEAAPVRTRRSGACTTRAGTPAPRLAPPSGAPRTTTRGRRERSVMGRRERSEAGI